jgi:hemophore-related protein
MISFPTYTLITAPLVIAVAVLVPVTIAQAEPAGPLVETTCSYEQLDAAARVEMPQLAAKLEQNPNAQRRIRDFLGLSVDQRKQRIREVLDRNPDWRQTIDEKRNTPEGQDKVAKLNRVADTCHGY